MGNILLHFLISDRVGNVPTLRPLGLIRNFFISDKYSKTQCRYAGEWNVPAFNSGGLIFVR